MRRFLLVAALLLAASFASANTIDTILSLPNARATQNLDLKTLATGPGASASILMYKQGLIALDVTAVDVNNTVYGGAAISTNLDQWKFLTVTYAWTGLLKTNVSLWAGLDLQSKSGTYGVSCSLISFGK